MPELSDHTETPKPSLKVQAPPKPLPGRLIKAHTERGLSHFQAFRRNLCDRAPPAEDLPAYMYLPDPVINAILAHYPLITCVADLRPFVENETFLAPHLDLLWESFGEFRCLIEELPKLAREKRNTKQRVSHHVAKQAYPEPLQQEGGLLAAATGRMPPGDVRSTLEEGDSSEDDADNEPTTPQKLVAKQQSRIKLDVEYKNQGKNKAIQKGPGKAPSSQKAGAQLKDGKPREKKMQGQSNDLYDRKMRDAPPKARSDGRARGKGKAKAQTAWVRQSEVEEWKDDSDTSDSSSQKTKHAHKNKITKPQLDDPINPRHGDKASNSDESQDSGIKLIDPNAKLGLN
ncbi:hypothetical protein OH77DRAFT_1525999 [Trametes cingulata]|nr:hypothetical protein OH77DRAFT_1525999 [Trametes cingulata]